MKDLLSKEQLVRVANQRIVFAHQSVGGNIVAGIREVASEHSINVNIIETQQAPPGGAGLFHFKIGTNGEPDGKLAEFEKVFANNAPANIDVAVLKLCYIDFTSSTDGAALAQRYIQTLDSLQAKYPYTQFMAVTAPLTTIQTGPKAWIKIALGKQPAGYVDNVRRATFNSVLRAHFPAQRLFDLAKIEATATGTLTQFEHEGRQIEALTPSLTSDGGHLNARGQRLVASEFLKQLSAAPRSQY